MTQTNWWTAMEAIEGDVTDHDMCMDLFQTIQEVFDQAVFPEYWKSLRH